MKVTVPEPVIFVIEMLGVPPSPVAVIVPDPVAAREAPVPTIMAAVVLVPPVKEPKAPELPPEPQGAPASVITPPDPNFTQSPFVPVPSLN